MCYYGNGFNQHDLYQMPTYLRNFYYNKLVDAKKKEADEVKKSNKANNSKVRVNR